MFQRRTDKIVAFIYADKVDVDVEVLTVSGLRSSHCWIYITGCCEQIHVHDFALFRTSFFVTNTQHCDGSATWIFPIGFIFSFLHDKKICIK